MKDLSEREKRRKRAYWRRAQRQSRERKKVTENQVTPPQSPEDDPQPQMSRYRFIDQIIGSATCFIIEAFFGRHRANYHDDHEYTT